MGGCSNWQWHLDEVFVKINGERHYLWRAVDNEGEVVKSCLTQRRDREAALKLIKQKMKRHGQTADHLPADRNPSTDTTSFVEHGR